MDVIPRAFGGRERATLIRLTNLRTSGPLPMAPKLNRRRALFVLEKIDQILSWEKIKEQEKDVRFIELGEFPVSYTHLRNCIKANIKIVLDRPTRLRFNFDCPAHL